MLAVTMADCKQKRVWVHYLTCNFACAPIRLT